MTYTMKPRPIHREKTPRRNEPCPCGSGKKAKKCCLAKIKFLASVPPQYREAVVADKILRQGLFAPAAMPAKRHVLQPGCGLGPTESQI